jgi:hypothetical protein
MWRGYSQDRGRGATADKAKPTVKSMLQVIARRQRRSTGGAAVRLQRHGSKVFSLSPQKTLALDRGNS